MSKQRMNTRQKILDKALEMFNEQGIEYVGLRELAAVLGIRVSNISYYFPTKDDLVYELSQQLSKANADVITERENLTMRAFLETFHRVFQNHVKYRCLLLSVVHLMKQNKHLAAAYKQTQTERAATVASNLKALEKAGYLKIQDETEREFLVSGISLISRFWISEAAISFRGLSTTEQIERSLSMLAKLLLPYTTAKAKEEVSNFLANCS